jgi:SAM-dependent methyltransferase
MTQSPESILDPDQPIKRMREDWNNRAREDARFYIACGHRNEGDEAFQKHAEDVVAFIRRDLSWLPPGQPESSLRFLEIGCGIGRLMSHLGHDCGEIHGVDISDEMIQQGRAWLSWMPHAHLHHAPHSDLRDFEDGSFDFIYSYAVFQHIPAPELIWRYLSDAARVLRTGGVLTAQVNTLPVERESYDTWSGAILQADQLVAQCQANGLVLRAVEGVGTQYTWITAQKSVPPPSRLSRPAVIRYVKSSDGSTDLVTERDTLHLAVAFLPAELCDVSELAIHLDSQAIAIDRISVANQDRERVLTARVPAGLEPGSSILTLIWKGMVVSKDHAITIADPPPREAKVLKATDGQELSRENVSSCGWVKLWLRDWFGTEEDFSVHLDGIALYRHLHCDDRFLGAWQINVELPKDLPPGPIELEVSFASPPARPIIVPVLVEKVGSRNPAP